MVAAIEIFDNVGETCTVTGTSNPYVTTGARPGMRTFATAGLANGDYVWWKAEDGVNWEIGYGIYTSATPSIARTQIIASSNANAAVSWPASSTKVIRCVLVMEYFNHSCGVSLAATQSIPNTTTTTVAWPNEDFDSTPEAMHDTVTNNSRITVQRDGLYLIFFLAIFASNNVGARQVVINKNSALLKDVIYPNNAAGEDHSIINVVAKLVRGDFLEAQVWQGSGGALNITNPNTVMVVARIGE